MPATAEQLLSIAPPASANIFLANRRSPALVFNKDTSALNSTGSNAICEAYGNFANHANVIPQRVPPEATGLLLWWVLASNAAVSALGTVPEFVVAGRIHPPVLTPGTNGQPNAMSGYDADMAVVDTDGLWVGLGAADPASQGQNYSVSASAFSDPDLSGTIMHTSGGWRVYTMPLVVAVTSIVIQKAIACRHVDYIRVYTSILPAYTSAGATDSAQMVIGSFI